jgi:hypothetical protein
VLPREPTSRAADELQGPSLREIAERLTIPARSGLPLTKQQLGELGARLSLPVGLAERSQMLMNLFRAAAELEKLPALLGALRDEVERWESQYRQWSTEYPASEAIWDGWRERLAETRTLLVEMAELVATGEPDQEAEAGAERA